MNTLLKIIEDISTKVNTNEIFGAFAGIFAIWGMLFACSKLKNLTIYIKERFKKKPIIKGSFNVSQVKDELSKIELFPNEWMKWGHLDGQLIPTDSLDVIISSGNEKLVTNLPTRLCLNTSR